MVERMKIVFYFQVSRCAVHSVSSKKDVNQVIYSLIFFGRAGRIIPFAALSAIEHTFQLGRQSGHGPYAMDTRKWEDELPECPIETYLQRIRRYRAEGLERLQHKGPNHPSLQVSASKPEIHELLRRISLNNAVDLVSVVERHLDIPYLREIALLHVLCLQVNIAAIKSILSKQNKGEEVSRYEG